MCTRRPCESADRVSPMVFQVKLLSSFFFVLRFLKDYTPMQASADKVGIDCRVSCPRQGPSILRVRDGLRQIQHNIPPTPTYTHASPL